MNHITTIFAVSCATLALMLGACDAPSEQKSSSQAISEPHIQISDARIKPPLIGRDLTAAYFSVTSFGSDDVLTGAASPIAERVELHTHQHDNGVMKMRRLDRLALPKGEAVEFKPGGHHLMLFGVKLADGQTEAPLTLSFETSPSITIIAEIAEPVMPEPHKKH